MASEPQTSLTEALHFSVPTSAETSIQLSNHLCFGNAAVGGYIAATLGKIAVLYGSRHPVLQKQPDVRSSTTTFYRPVLPSQGPCKVKVIEVSIGKAWSFLRAEISQGENGKLSANTDLILTNYSIPGITLDTHWKLTPPPTPVDLLTLEQGPTNENPNGAWTTYHTPFYPQGFRRGHAYVKYFFPKTYTPTQSYVEQWVLPGWDCHPLGSRNEALPEARWTNETLPYLADMNMPVQENYFPHHADKPLPMGSVASTLQFASTQQQQKQKDSNNNETWRDLNNADGSRPDGIKAFLKRGNTLNSTISMSIEFKKKLPAEGERWLYLRGEIKSVRDGRQDWQVLCFDRGMDLVFIRTGLEQILDPGSKNARKAKPGSGSGSGAGGDAEKKTVTPGREKSSL